MIENAMKALLGAIREQAPEDWKGKAEIIGEFATGLSEMIADRLGMDADDLKFAWAIDEGPDGWKDLLDNRPPDILFELQLSRVSSSLVVDQDSEIMLLFCKGRVLDRTIGTGKNRRVMTYEETARFVLFWFAEKLIQIIRKNHYDRVEKLPNLLDRLLEIVAA